MNPVKGERLTELMLHYDIRPVDLPGVVIQGQAVAAVFLLGDTVEQGTGQTIGQFFVVLNKLKDGWESFRLVDVELQKKKRCTLSERIITD